MAAEIANSLKMQLFRNCSKFVLLWIWAVCSISSVSVAAMPSKQDSVANSSVQFRTIAYTDYNLILNGLVLDKGPSSRTFPTYVKPPVGTKISFVSRKNTRLESNRVMFDVLRNRDEETIHNARLDLEAIPALYPLNSFSKNERLAYWLNIRNLTVIDELSQRYPLRKLKKFWRELENKRILHIDGRSMSINDIEKHIMTVWPKAEVIYGFYNGSIGGPNIRRRAYTGRTVWSDLKYNAAEFVNSLRGIQFWNQTAKVSSFYSKYGNFFPNLDHDLRRHLYSHLKTKLASKLRSATELSLSIEDWFIADLMNGRIGLSSAGSIRQVSHSQRQALNKYPAHVQAYLLGIRQRLIQRRKKGGVVSIEVVDAGVSKKTETKD